MDIEKINKLVNNSYRSPDNTLGKYLLLKMHPEIRSRLEDGLHLGKIMYKRELREFGVELKTKEFLQFEERDFPELFED